MTVIPKWKVTVPQPNAPALVLFIHDPFLANVLRTLATIGFEQEPSALTIARVEPEGPASDVRVMA